MSKQRTNNDNLVNLANRPEAERKAIAHKGGKRSGESKRERKALKDELIAILESGNTKERVCTALIGEAIEGNYRAFLAIRDTIGEKPVEELTIEQHGVSEQALAEMREFLERTELEWRSGEGKEWETGI